MSLLPAYMDELWNSYEQMRREEMARVDVNLLSVEPLECHSSVLPFLAWEYDVNINEFDAVQQRSIVVNAIENSYYIGTLYSVKNIFNSVGSVVIDEYFEEKPFYFKAKMLIDSELTSINKYAYLLEKYKNVRSKFELEFDLDTNANIYESAASNVAVDFFNEFELEKEFHFVVDAKNSFYSGFDAKLAFEKVSNYETSASSAFDVETSRDFFDVGRLSDVKNQAIANMRLDFSYNESDVMHLPIPPIELKTVVGDMAIAVFDMDFTQNSSDVFHLNYEKHYEALGGVDIGNYGAVDMEFYDSGVDLNTITQTLTANAVQSVNLDI